MRSTRRATGGQEALWDGPSAPGGVRLEPVALPSARRRVGAPAEPRPLAWTRTLRGDEFARRGWPAGTVLHVVAASRVDRGDLAVVDDGGRHLVGFLGLDRGRPALLDDTGSTWLADRARVVGVVTAVEAPLSP